MKKSKSSTKNIFFSRRFTVPFSVIMSFILWLSLTVVKKPTIERSFSDMTVTINMENTFASENDMSIIGDISEQKFTVTVQGPNASVGSLTPSDITLYASAASVDAPGQYDLDVLSGTSSNYQILNITPSTVKVNFDYIETREFNIKPSAAGASASEGLIAEEPVVSGTEKSTVKITGPRTIINSIETVAAKATVNKTLSASETFDASILLYDADGGEISRENLSLSTDKVSVTVPISKKKTVAVKLDFSNAPSGFNKESISAVIDHPTVTVIGSPDTIDKTTQVTLSPIDLSKVSAKKATYDVAPKLPEGVRLLDAIESFSVTLNLDKYAETTVNVTTVKFVGLSKDLRATIGKNIKNVKICGPESVIKNLDRSKVYAEVNLAEKSVGEHTINATIKFMGYNDIWAVGSYQTSVTIKQ